MEFPAAEVLRHHFMAKIGRPQPVCPVCAHDNWHVPVQRHVLLPHDGEKVVTDSPVIPLVILICGHCSNTLLVPWVPMERAWREATYVP